MGRCWTAHTLFCTWFGVGTRLSLLASKRCNEMCTNEWVNDELPFTRGSISLHNTVCVSRLWYVVTQVATIILLHGALRIVSRTWTQQCHIRYRYLLISFSSIRHPSVHHVINRFTLTPLARGVTSCSLNLVPYLHTPTSLWCPPSQQQFAILIGRSRKQKKKKMKTLKAPQNRSLYMWRCNAFPWRRWELYWANHIKVGY